MALNDGVLAGLGFDPVTVGVVASVAVKVAGMFGPSQEFLERQAYRDAGAEILAKIKAIIPSLPQWIQKTVTDDREEFRQKLIRPDMKTSDYKAAIAWMQGREAAWQLMLQQGPTSVGAVVPSAGFEIPPGMTPDELRRQIYVNTLRREAGDVVAPSGAGVVTSPSAVVPLEAGFSWPVLLVIGGIVAAVAFGSKK